MQDDLNLRILRMLKGTFSRNEAHLTFNKRRYSNVNRVLIFIEYMLYSFLYRIYRLFICAATKKKKKIKALTALVGRFSLSEGWENGHEWGLKNLFFHLTLNFMYKVI